MLFITTANYLDGIPHALLDRMELIEFTGYMEEEKLEIGRQFLVPKQIEQHGLADKGVSFEDDALKSIIREYTREAGVRNFERETADVCRKIAAFAEKQKYPRRITAKRVQDLLGRLGLCRRSCKRKMKSGLPQVRPGLRQGVKFCLSK